MVFEVAARVDPYVDSAHFCSDLHQTDTGRRSRELAGLHAHVPGQDDCCHVRSRAGDAVVHTPLAVMVELLRPFGLITGELLSTDGQREPTYARSTGCAYACEGCQPFPVDAAGQAALRDPLQSGAARLQVTCPFPEVVATVREATAKQGNPGDPQVTPRHADRAPEALVARGDDANGTPYAPCGRLCHANGYDSAANARQYVCGRPCPPAEQQRCPHAAGVRGSSHRMTCPAHPRLMGPIQRGTTAWQRLYAARSASERPNSSAQEVLANAHPLRRRGLKAFRFAGAIRTLAQLLRRALNFVLDVTSTLGTAPMVQT